MSTDTPSGIDLTDDEVDTLLDRMLERADQRGEIDLGQLAQRGVSRRTLLAGMATAGGIGALTGNASAAPNWGNASGSAGTEANPLNSGYIQDLFAQAIDTDEVVNTELGSTPSTPSSGERKLYAKSDGYYQLDSSGTESVLGSGGGVAGTDLGTL